MPDRRGPRGRRLVRTTSLGVAGLSLLAFTVTRGAVATAAGANAFDGTAAGYGFTTLLENGSIPAGISPELDGPTAQAHLDSLGDSDAFSASPYLGEDVTGLPGLAGGLSGIPLPADPLFATTSLGDQPKTVNAGAITLRSTSQAGHATSTADTGTSSTGATSSADVSVDPDQSVRAIATAEVRGLDVGGVVRIAGVDARAETDRDPSGAITTSSSLDIGHISVPGLALSVPDCFPTSVPLPVAGLPTLPTMPAFCLSQVPGLAAFAGKSLSAPDLTFRDGTFSVIVFPQAGGPAQSIALPAASVLSALSAAGVTATYQRPVELKEASGRKNGVQGASLTFSTKLPSPPPPISSQISGPTTITTTIGNVSAHVDYTVVPDVLTTDAVPVGQAPLPTTGPPAGVPGAGTGSPIDSSGAAFGATTPDGGTVGATGSGAGLAPQIAGSAPVTTAPQAAALRSSDEHRLANIYPILVIAGLLAYAMTHVARSSGRRFRWIS